MRKLKILLLLILTLTVTTVSASTNTYTRTEDDYRVPDRIKITNKNKNDILKTPSVDASEKIYDFADLLTDTEEETLFELATDYIEKANIDMVIVTINNNNKKSEVEYADDFLDYNDFGLNQSRDAVLFLIDMDNRQIYISTMGQAIKIYSDARIDKVIDAGYTQLKAAQYFDCLSNMISQAKIYAENGAPKGSDVYIDENGQAHYRIPFLPIILGSAVLSLIITLILYYKSKSVIKAENTASYYLDKKNSHLNMNSKFKRTYTSKVPRSTSSGSSGGGHSSFHSSGGGISHGGGGRGF